jgi:hypothetical protein
MAEPEWLFALITLLATAPPIAPPISAPTPNMTGANTPTPSFENTPLGFESVICGQAVEGVAEAECTNWVFCWMPSREPLRPIFGVTDSAVSISVFSDISDLSKLFARQHPWLARQVYETSLKN